MVPKRNRRKIEAYNRFNRTCMAESLRQCKRQFQQNMCHTVSYTNYAETNKTSSVLIY